MAKKMLIDATHLEETRVVVADGNKVDEFDFESINKRQLAGNIYLAKIMRVEPSLQAAFVDYGGNRHGFLAFSEIHPDYYQIPVADREALLAEEAAEQQRAAVRVEEGEEKSKSRSRRGKRRPRDQKPEPSTAGNEVKGLEVIELSEDDSGADSAPDIVDTTPPEVKGLAEVKGLEIADEPVTQAASAEDDAKTVEAPVESAPSEEAAPETPDEPGAAPKSIAESAGLDDDDSVSEEIVEAAPEKSEAEEKPKPKPRAKRTRKKAVAAPKDDAAAEVAAGDTPAGEAAPEGAGAEVAALEVIDTPAPESGELGAGDVIEDAAKTTDQPADEEAKKPARPPRKRRSRAKVQSDDTGDAAPEADEPVEAVESTGSSDDTQEEAAKDRAKRRRHYKIQDVIKVRQIMLIQVVKEERGNKGAALTTYLSLAGRYCVLMPNTARGGGISRKITSAGDRKRLREITDELEVPNGIGLIVRTAGAERTRPEIKRDFEFLLRQWQKIRDLTLKSIAPSLIYEEGSLIKRSIRDLYSKEIDTILVEGEAGFREAKDYMKMLMPSHAKNVQQYNEQIPLYIRYQVESYLNAMFNPVVQLRSGGYIVIGITEALVAIDVNSGRSTKESSIEDTATKTNLEAADEVARQLRLRDLAGLIVIDFIDMDDNRNNRAVEKRMKDRLKSDRARIQIGRISAFGLMEMSRQRLRPGMLEATTQPCPHCKGQGIVRSDENLSLSILREVEEEGVRGRSAEVTVTAPIEIANYILNMKRVHLAHIEERYGLAATIFGDATLKTPEFRIDRSRTRSRQIDAPDVVITAESAVVHTTLDEAEAEVESSNAPADNRPDESSDERGEGKSRRRRGKRGGQRRRRDEGEENNAGQTSGDGGQGGSDTEAATGETPEGENKATGERRSRRRRGGRGRSRRQEGEAVAEAVTETAVTETGEAGPDGAATAETAETTVQPEPVETVAEAMPEEATAEAPVETPVDTPEAEVAEEKAAEAPVEVPVETPVEDPAEPEAEAVVETAKEPVTAPEPELVAAAPVVSEPEKPAAPKRRGWWSRG
jgi:ribonuclease E